MDETYAIPITVGVVGHIDVVTTESHSRQISNLFCALAEQYPNSPVYLFSSVADGADRFVANIFLDLKKSRPEFRERFELIIPTPFCPDEYRKDFDGASLAEFDILLKEAKSNFCISCEEFKNDRPLQYLRTGKFVADSSVILIALWDGEKGRKGGTADIVRHKISGDDDNVADSIFGYDGTVFILPCNRKKSAGRLPFSSGNGETLSLEIVLKDPAIKETLEKIEEINSMSAGLEEEIPRRSQSCLFRSREKLDSSQNSLLKWYSIFDTLSLSHRRREMRISIWLFVIGMFLIVALEIYSNLFHINMVLGALMLFLIIAVIIYFFSNNQKNHTKYLYNRTLAEALRIQFYWNIAGINRNVSDFFLRIHRKDLTWVKHLLSAIHGITYTNKNISTEIIEDLTSSWVIKQAGFFKFSISRMRKQLGVLQKVSNGSFLIAFALLVSIFFLRDYYDRYDLHGILLVVIGTFLGIFALIKGYIKMKSYEQLLNQYELMSVIYSRAESKITGTETYDLSPAERNSYLRELFFVIGKEALIENGNWYLIFKEKEPEIKGI